MYLKQHPIKINLQLQKIKLPKVRDPINFFEFSISIPNLQGGLKGYWHIRKYNKKTQDSTVWTQLFLTMNSFINLNKQKILFQMFLLKPLYPKNFIKKH